MSRVCFLLLSTVVFFSAFVSAQHWTSHSPLTAFKQLGFDGGYSYPHQSQAAYIPYSISDFNSQHQSQSQQSQLVNKQTPANSADGFQQIKHPNDILSNMGVDLPPEEILGRPSFEPVIKIDRSCQYFTVKEVRKGLVRPVSRAKSKRSKPFEILVKGMLYYRSKLRWLKKVCVSFCRFGAEHF